MFFGGLFDFYFGESLFGGFFIELLDLILKSFFNGFVGGFGISFIQDSQEYYLGGFGMGDMFGLFVVEEFLRKK